MRQSGRNASMIEPNSQSRLGSGQAVSRRKGMVALRDYAGAWRHASGRGCVKTRSGMVDLEATFFQRKLRQYFVLARVAAHGPLRKVFPPDYRNWSFHTASAQSRRSTEKCPAAVRPVTPVIRCTCTMSVRAKADNADGMEPH